MCSSSHSRCKEESFCHILNQKESRGYMFLFCWLKRKMQMPNTGAWLQHVYCAPHRRPLAHKLFRCQKIQTSYEPGH